MWKNGCLYRRSTQLIMDNGIVNGMDMTVKKWIEIM